MRSVSAFCSVVLTTGFVLTATEKWFVAYPAVDDEPGVMVGSVEAESGEWLEIFCANGDGTVSVTLGWNQPLPSAVVDVRLQFSDRPERVWPWHVVGDYDAVRMLSPVDDVGRLMFLRSVLASDSLRLTVGDTAVRFDMPNTEADAVAALDACGDSGIR